MAQNLGTIKMGQPIPIPSKHNSSFASFKEALSRKLQKAKGAVIHQAQRVRGFAVRNKEPLVAAGVVVIAAGAGAATATLANSKSREDAPELPSNEFHYHFPSYYVCDSWYDDDDSYWDYLAY